MNSPHPRTARAHRDLVRELFALERSGHFEQAMAELRGIWDDTTDDPQVQNLDSRTGAEIYLRCGALIGFLGHSRQIPSAQDRSKNLLTRARSTFLEMYAPEKLAECENYLALAYWRMGEINEAESWIQEAQSHELSDSCDAWLYSHVIRNLIRLSQKRFAEICQNFSELRDSFMENADDFLIGNFYMNFGVAARNIGDISKALDSLCHARDFFGRAGNKVQVAMVENNLSYLYKSERRFVEAHDAIDRGTDLFRQVGDRTREGFSLDSKALIYLDEGRYHEALEAVEQGILILRKSENYGYLTESIATKARIQLFSSDFSTATLTLLEAVELAKIRVSENAAMRLIREFEQALNERNLARERNADSVRTGLASDDLKLILPTSISHYEDYQGIWISNSDLEQYGLARGSLAVVVRDNVLRGDLVAVIEISTDLVSCGIYDSDFGIVCLEVSGSEPQLFDASDVKILGKIVGVCRSEKNADGTLEVFPLDL
ncbi:MAG: tetratricopeptide repeat protein [Pyrinomonadaceae bacterium]